MRMVVAALAVAGAASCVQPDPTPPNEQVVTSRRPPPRPAATAPGERRWFAVKRVYLGPTRRDNGIADVNAWKDFGYDLDRRHTTSEDSKTSRSSCRRKSDSSSVGLTDGLAGVDNNFGRYVYPVLKSVKAEAEEAANTSLVEGAYTLLLRIDGAVDGSTSSAPGALYAAGPRASDDSWPVWSTALADGVDLEKPIRKFPLGYIADGTWVSGEIGESPEPIWIPMFNGPADIYASAIVTLRMGDGYGVIAGAIPEDEMVRAVEGVLALFGICRQSNDYAYIKSTLTHPTDLVMGATDLQDPSRSCDSISFGIGFDATRVADPTKVVAGPSPPPAVKDCAPDSGVSD